MTRKHDHGVVARVLVAACSGSARVSGDIGLPLVHIGATLDVAASLHALNERCHGCAERWPGSFQPLRLQSGWDDWKECRLEAEVATLAPHGGVQIVDGRILAALPAATPVSEFAGQLAGALRHLRLQEATIRPGYLAERCDAMAEMVVHPRYSVARPRLHDFRDAVVVDDLYVIDPSECGWRLYWLAVAARMAATQGRHALWK